MDIRPTNQQVTSYDRAIRKLVLEPLQSNLIKSLKTSPKTAKAWRDTINRIFNSDSYNENLDDKTPDLSDAYINKLDEYHQKKFNREMINSYAINVSELLINDPVDTTLDDIIEDNVNLIKSIPEQLLDQVNDQFNQIIVNQGGFDQNALLNMLTDRFSVATSRAGLIARDQSLKTMGSLDKVRQKQVGFREFIWRNVGDGAVRQEHQNHPVGVASVSYPWSTGANIPERYPKVAVNCRCFAEPVVGSNSLLFGG